MLRLPVITAALAAAVPGSALAGTLSASASMTGLSASASMTGGSAFTEPALGAEPAALHGRATTLRGRRPEAAGRQVRVERLLPTRVWETLGVVTADAAGAFAVPWRARGVGRYELRSVVDDGPPVGYQTAAGPAPPQLTVYRPVGATWYGPGFFGRRTACGQRLRRGTRGVAHRTLPCGSVVEIAFGGRSVQAPVIDRGPFHADIHYDLTQALAGELGFTGRQTIGVVTISRPAATR